MVVRSQLLPWSFTDLAAGNENAMAGGNVAPSFMWLLRDFHLQVMDEGREVCMLCPVTQCRVTGT